MKLLELFSGTHSVGKVAKKLNYEIISLDLANADINLNILDWDYKQFKPGHFDIIWASPPCSSFSRLQNIWIGRIRDGKIFTKEQLKKDINDKGLPLLDRTLEIIEYFQPKVFFIENPFTGVMKDYMNDDIPFYVVDYCAYGYKYQKRTIIWSNVKNFNAKLCNKNHNGYDKNKFRHTIHLGGDNDPTDLNERYSIPPKLIKSLFNSIK